MHYRVKRIALEEEGRPMEVKRNNPLLDHIHDEVGYIYGITEVLTDNIIAEKILD